MSGSIFGQQRKFYDFSYCLNVYSKYIIRSNQLIKKSDLGNSD